jgi:hypothetical protein
MPLYKNNEIHARLVRPQAANSGVFAFAGATLGGMLALAGCLMRKQREGNMPSPLARMH